jgi:hypothetical protein
VIRGRYLAVLDADDWMYPTRLERQVAWLENDPRLKLVASSMLIESASHSVIGVQDVNPGAGARLGSHPFSFAPILVDADLARKIRFRPELTRAEDVAFLTHALASPWACFAEPLYAYRPSAPTRASTLESYRCSRRAYALERGRFPLAARRLEVSYGLREIAHGVLSESASRRLTSWSRARVVRPATPAEERSHDEALAHVLRRVRGGSAPRTAPQSGDVRA